MTEKSICTLDDILAILPHRPPFLFVDKVTLLVPHRVINAKREVRPDEFYFQGHFPKKPLMPGVIITEALAQTSGLLWGLSKREDPSAYGENPELFYLAAADMKYVGPAFPGDILCLVSSFEKCFGALYRYAVEAFVGKKVVAKGLITLAMADNKE
jgi:3-hydroxymyristoyl/3-hydroxydecanoyl-(acyl carrier protein) dehydratase